MMTVGILGCGGRLPLAIGVPACDTRQQKGYINVARHLLYITRLQRVPHPSSHSIQTRPARTSQIQHWCHMSYLSWLRQFSRSALKGQLVWPGTLHVSLHKNLGSLQGHSMTNAIYDTADVNDSWEYKGRWSIQGSAAPRVRFSSSQLSAQFPSQRPRASFSCKHQCHFPRFRGEK